MTWCMHLRRHQLLKPHRTFSLLKLALRHLRLGTPTTSGFVLGKPLKVLLVVYTLGGSDAG